MPYLYTFVYTANCEKTADEILALIKKRGFLPFDKLTVITTGTTATVYLNGNDSQLLFVKAEDTQVFEDLRFVGWKLVLGTAAQTVRLICQRTR
jgi:hypothetical protein